MKKLALAIAVLVAMGAALAYAYMSPTLAFDNMEVAVAANDVDTFSGEIDRESVRAHLRNLMSLQMQDSLRSYSTRPNSAATEARLAPYFDKRSAALATPASLLRELDAQLKGQSGNMEVRFAGLSEVHIVWASANERYEAQLSRQGLIWKLAALDFPDAMPRYWDQPTTLIGTYYQSSFKNCCVGGQATETPYGRLQLSTAVDVLDVYPDDDPAWNMSNVTVVQVGAPDSTTSEMIGSTKDGDSIEVHCKRLWQGTTGHYALPVYCEVDQIKRVAQPSAQPY